MGLQQFPRYPAGTEGSTPPWLAEALRRARTQCAPSCLSRAWRPRSHAERPGATVPAASEPGVKRVGDIHLYPHPGRDSICLATVPGCCTKKAVGYAIGATARAPTPLCEAIDMAVRRCPYTTGETVFHSDRGRQYTFEQLARHLENYGTRPSVGRTEVCWDNAWAEVGGCDPEEREGLSDGVFHKKQGHPGYCLLDRAGIQSETTPLRSRVQDAGRGRGGAPSNKTSSLKDRFQGRPRHAQQPTGTTRDKRTSSRRDNRACHGAYRRKISPPYWLRELLQGFAKRKVPDRSPGNRKICLKVRSRMAHTLGVRTVSTVLAEMTKMIGGTLSRSRPHRVNMPKWTQHD